MDNNNKKDKAKKKKSSLTKYKKQLEEKEKEIQELKDKYLRLMAEFENYKKRVVKEKEELRNTGSENVMLALLPVLDDFDRAKAMAEDPNTQESFSEGVQLVYDKLFSALKSQGLEKYDSTGEEFNPEEHEAIAEIPVENEEHKGKIIDTVEKGYKLKGKIIRYPKGVVGK